jgi:hypothetical protein
MTEKELDSRLGEILSPSKGLTRVTHSSIEPARDARLDQCPTNLDLSTWQGKVLALAAGSPADLVIPDNGVLAITATHYFLFPDIGQDPESGEIKEFTRTVLYDREGRTYRTTSGHAPHRIKAILELISADEWAKGIPFVISERRSRATGRTYHDIRPSPTRDSV